ncbi:hypothetical protein, partial [Aquitalea magnusonii]|uniref:hypothetical protein n=1 Tax=Aquitalea magnusonii TaxID=332411 RepID=UPI00128F5133
MHHGAQQQRFIAGGRQRITQLPVDLLDAQPQPAFGQYAQCQVLRVLLQAGEYRLAQLLAIQQAAFVQALQHVAVVVYPVQLQIEFGQAADMGRCIAGRAIDIGAQGEGGLFQIAELEKDLDFCQRIQIVHLVGQCLVFAVFRFGRGRGSRLRRAGRAWRLA